MSARWKPRACVGALLALGLAATGSAGVAAPPVLDPLRVEVSAPGSCPAEPSLLVRVRTHTSRIREAVAAEPARLLEVVVTEQAGGFVADLRLVDDRDELVRRVPGKTCEEVLAAVALITALTIDARPPATTPVARAPDAGAVARVRAAGVDAGPPPAPERPRGVAVSLGTSLDVHGLGEPVLGESFWVEAGLARALAPSLRLRLARSQSLTAEEAGRAAVFRLDIAALEACVAVVDVARVQLRPCLQATGGVLEASSAAFGPTHRAVRPWAAAGLLAQGRWRLLGPLALELGIGASAPFVREDFYFLPRTTVYRPPPVVLLGNVGLGTTFP